MSINAMDIYVNAFVDELQRAGIHQVVICPGSRSTPLALAFARHPEMRVWMQVDERSAAFFALGMAKWLGHPVALLCTSGTAAANFLPAIVEAKLSHVPLLVLTADRPHELRDVGAPQAIDQNRLYGTHVKWFVDVALPEESDEMLCYIRTLANRAAALTQAIPAGPVHLNFPFREPLVPNTPLNLQNNNREMSQPYVRVADAQLASVPKETVEYVAQQACKSTEGLIIVGPIDNPALTQPLIELAHQLNYPLLADPLSQLRCGPHDRNHLITAYDALLHNPAFAKRAPQLILRFGAMPTAKTLLLYIKQHAQCPQIVIDGQNDWPEPTQLADMMIHANPIAFCNDLLKRYQELCKCGGLTTDAIELGPYKMINQSNVVTNWLSYWQESDHLARETLQSKINQFELLFEGRVFSELADLLPKGANLFVGNSMPVRDLDSFFWHTSHNIRILCNRGANGIDGVISSALGVSAASNDGQTVLVIGDLSFYHDMNGLLAAHLHHLNITIILINNNGGGIFSFLPQAEHPEYFEQLFGTPLNLGFQPAVQMYGGQFRRIATWEEFRQAVRQSFACGGLHVIEVPTERKSNVEMHRQLWQAVGQAIK